MKKAIYFIDLTHESKLGFSSDHMPLQLGLIAAFCRREHGEYADVEIFKFGSELEKAVRKRPPFILAASNYLWNLDLEYKFASAVKELYPETIVIFGGPNYPDTEEEQVQWLKRYPQIDFYVYKDGEVPFSNLVGRLFSNPDIAAAKKALLPSCHALVGGIPYFGKLAPRLTDLSAIPSPYLEGLMDKFFEHQLVPAIQTNRGCPFSCTFCVEGESYYTKIYRTTTERKAAEVDYIAARVKHTNTLRIVDSNFGMFAEDEEFCRYINGIQRRTGYPDWVSCSAGKNQKDRILRCNELLGGAMRLTASVQSLVPDVLRNIKRSNISLEELMAVSDKVSDTDTHAHSEIILGLPGDSLAGQEESLRGLMEAGISNITQHQLALLCGTDVASKKSREQFGMRSMFRPGQRCVGRYRFLDKTLTAIDIEEICVGLNTLSFDDYLESRRLYLTVGLFYNDRIFGEINALLRLLHLSAWEWIKLVHQDIINAPPAIRALYDGFIVATKSELWESPEVLSKDVGADIDKYIAGEAGGNLIYRYRAMAIVGHFLAIHAVAFSNLRRYLALKDVSCEDLVAEIEKFSRYQKANMLDPDFVAEEVFNYDIVKMITDPVWARTVGTLKDIQRPTRIRISHTQKQKESIKERLAFYGADILGLTMLMSRFPIKRFYRTAEVINPTSVPAVTPPVSAT